MARPALRRGAAGVGAMALVLLSTALASAGDLTVRGLEMNRFGRIALEFEKPNKVAARSANGILVITFGEAVRTRVERLAAEIPSYVSVVRLDPDGTGMRLALTASYRVNVLEAGEKVFVDILPENWTGLLPGLPPEVIAELARRAHEAEAKVRLETIRRKSDAARVVKARVASLPTLTRIVFEPPTVVPVRFSTRGNEAQIVFDDDLLLDQAQIAGQLAPAVRTLTADEGGRGSRGPPHARIRLRGARVPRGRGLRARHLEGAGRRPHGAAHAGGAGPAEAACRRCEGNRSAAGRGTCTRSRRAIGRLSRRLRNFRLPRRPPGPVVPTSLVTSEGLRIDFPFSRRAGAAAFERAGVLTLVFHTSEPVSLHRTAAGGRGVCQAPRGRPGRSLRDRAPRIDQAADRAPRAAGAAAGCSRSGRAMGRRCSRCPCRAP